MSNAWELKQEDSREPDSLPTFIIFCEDTISESVYFKYFETSRIKVNPIESQRSKMNNVINAVCHCRAHGMMNCEEGEEVFSMEGTQIWCVFDRDIENDSSVEKGNAEFDLAIKSAYDKGLKVAWSNDSFELWVLLHFENVDMNNPDYSNRQTYYDRLTEIFKTLAEPNEDLQRALSHPSFSYKKDLKSENNFRYIVRPEIVTKTGIAIARANELRNQFDITQGIYHRISPCTSVQDLIEELLKYGGKQI